MKKLIGLLLLLSSIVAVALNFNGSASLNGLQSTVIFTAPSNGYYFLKGYLSLSQPSLNGASGFSQVQAVVSNTRCGIIYTGISGASGLQINQISMVSGDAISVRLQSNATIDQGINAVSGQVYYGNSF
jgi:hypothetical protein